MKYIFTKPGLKIIESLTFTRTLYAFDFDGTLAPIVGVPDKARASEKTEDLLETIYQNAPLAVISGRSVRDLKKRVGFPAHHFIGNHGLEGLTSSARAIEQAKILCAKWKKTITRNPVKDPGVFVEDKTYSLALHYRHSRRKKQTRLELLKRAEELSPRPRIVLGKCVINVIPPGAPHKGVAILELMKIYNAKSALYIGDDDTDEDVFSVPNERIISVRVGAKKTSQAKYFINRQNEINRLLKLIAKGLQSQK